MANTDGKKYDFHIDTNNQEISSGIDPEKWNVIIRTIGTRNDSLIEALYSVALQSYPKKSVILVAQLINENDHLFPELERIVERFTGILEIKLLKSNPTKKRGHPFNLALDHRDGKYISFLDDDDIYHPRFSDTLVRKILKGGFNFVLGNSTSVQQTKIDNHYKTIKKELLYGEPFNPLKLITDNRIPINTYVLDFEEFRGVKFDENLDVLEDWDFLLQLMKTRRIKSSYENIEVSEYRIRTDKSNSSSSNYGTNQLQKTPPTLKHAKAYIPAKYFDTTFPIGYLDAFKTFPDVNFLLNIHAGNSEIEKILSTNSKSFQKLLTEKDNHIRNIESIISDKDNHIRNIESIISDKDNHIRNLEKLISDKDNHIKNIETILTNRINPWQNIKEKIAIIKSSKLHPILRWLKHTIKSSNK